jgi:hypothetical protein
MSYLAEAINAAVREANEQAQEQWRDYGGFLWQSELPLPSEQELGGKEVRRLVIEGYARQAGDYPNG